jgi:hypothetical protein
MASAKQKPPPEVAVLFKSYVKPDERLFGGIGAAAALFEFLSAVAGTLVIPPDLG